MAAKHEGPTFRSESACPEGHFVGRDCNGNSLRPVCANWDCLPFRQGSEMHGSFYWDWAQSVEEPAPSCLDTATPSLALHLLALPTLWLLERMQRARAVTGSDAVRLCSLPFLLSELIKRIENIKIIFSFWYKQSVAAGKGAGTCGLGINPIDSLLSAQTPF